METRPESSTALMRAVLSSNVDPIKEEYDTLHEILTLCIKKFKSIKHFEMAIRKERGHNHNLHLSEFLNNSTKRKAVSYAQLSPKLKEELYTFITTDERVKNLFQERTDLIEKLKAVKDQKQWTIENLKRKQINTCSQQEEEDNKVLRKIISFMAAKYKEENPHMQKVRSWEFVYLRSLRLSVHLCSTWRWDNSSHFTPDAKNKLYKNISDEHHIAVISDENGANLVEVLKKIKDRTPWIKKSKKIKLSSPPVNLEVEKLVEESIVEVTNNNSKPSDLSLHSNQVSIQQSEEKSSEVDDDNQIAELLTGIKNRN
ncbi:MAG: hypothetical protein A3F12_07335 [Gammaproteobacteria bacterium RIFCSPHIGHO2_12_FULL_38_14]|nr:MAG: hypothetical protein A3F12_07335 [Gammaproteobacteria bacterium RIFCSPHIGHO2_12_FULL_38_14]